MPLLGLKAWFGYVRIYSICSLVLEMHEIRELSIALAPIQISFVGASDPGLQDPVMQVCSLRWSTTLPVECLYMTLLSPSYWGPVLGRHVLQPTHSI